MSNYDNVTKKHEHNLNLPQITDHPYRILLIGGSGLEKETHYLIWWNNKTMMIIALLSKLYVQKLYVQKLYVQDSYETKYLYLIKKREKNGLENLKDLKAFIEYSNNMQDVIKNIEK